MSSGEEKGWNKLIGLKPVDVCKGAGAGYDHENAIYSLKTYGWQIHISLKDKRVFCNEPGSDILFNELSEHYVLSLLWYLSEAKDIPATGQLIRPDNLKGGHLFSRGTHILPLDRISVKYDKNIEGFFLKGKSLGAEKSEYGDASIQLSPFPRIPVTLIFWKGDDEFPSRTDLLFDSTSQFQMPIDILWSSAMMSVLIMV